MKRQCWARHMDWKILTNKKLSNRVDTVTAPDDDDTGPTIIINQQSSTRILILKAVKKKPANPEIGKKIPKCNENGEKHCQLSQYLLPNYLNINFN